MNKKLHVIYLPGVGDSDPVFQRRAVKTWKWWGVEAELLQVDWASEEPWSSKFKKITDRIDELTSAGKSVALVGASAGGSALISAYAARKNDIVGAVIICGKLKNATDIGSKYRNANPALVDAVTASDKASSSLNPTDRAKILTRRAFFDEVVTTHDDSIIEGARNRISPTLGHAITIAIQLVLGAPSIVRFLKKQNIK